MTNESCFIPKHKLSSHIFYSIPNFERYFPILLEFMIKS